MRILHILSQQFITGAEVYTARLVDSMVGSDNSIFIVSDTFSTPCRVQHISQPIDKRDLRQRFTNIRFIKNFIHDNDIDIIHSHSRASSWIAHFAAMNTAAVHVSTVHGRQGLHASTWLYDIYGKVVIAVCGNIRQHLIREVKMNPAKIRVIPNGFDFPDMPDFVTNSRDNVIRIIGRSSGPKGARTSSLIENVIGPLLAEHPSLYFEIICDNLYLLRQSALDKAEILNMLYDKRISFSGFRSDLSISLRNSALNICSGRIAIESLFYNAPTLALGEGGYAGLVTEQNLNIAMESNFGDINPLSTSTEPDYNQVIKDIETALSSKPACLGQTIKEIYHIDRVRDEIMNCYMSARIRKFHPSPIPVLMYHQVTEKPPENPRIPYITSKNLEKHFSFFRLRGLMPVTFRDYYRFRSGLLPPTGFPKKPVILTFDDGYYDYYLNLLPLLRKFNYKCIIFALGDPSVQFNDWDRLNGYPKLPLLNDDHLGELIGIGVEIGSHSLSHKDLVKLDKDSLLKEVALSKHLLESRLNIEVLSFAYPYGSYNDEAKEAVRRADFKSGFASDSGSAVFEDDPACIFRVNMFPRESYFSLYKKTSKWYRKYYRLKRKK